MKAALLAGVERPMELAELPDPRPRRGEVLVEVAGCGVCHTDLHVIRGEVAFPTPAVLGHEISGIVAETGAGVDDLERGTRVACSFIMPCGECRHCVRGWEDLCESFFTHNRLAGRLYDGESRLVGQDGQPIAMYSMAGLAEYAVVPATATFRLPDGIRLNDAAVLGCSVFTAYGAARNVADLRPTETVAVVAAGGVGLNIVQLSAAFGASKIIAIDLGEDKLALARELGATDTVNAQTEDPVQAVRTLTGGRGVDVAFEALGSAQTAKTAIDIVDDGGRVVLVGIAPAGVTAEIDIAKVVRRKINILGSYGGRARRDMPAVLALAAAGKVRLDRLITDRFDLDHAEVAYRRLAQRDIVGRGIIDVTEPTP